MQPILPLSKEILLPKQIAELQIQSPIGTAAIEYHIQSGQSLIVVPQQTKTLYPAADDLFHIGCTGRVLRSIGSQSGTIRVLIEGLQRVRIKELQEDPNIGYVATPYVLKERARARVVRRVALMNVRKNPFAQPQIV